MNLKRTLSRIGRSALAIAAATLLISCDIFEDDDYEINIMTTCSGGTNDNFTVSYLINNRKNIPAIQVTGINTSFLFPAGKKIEKVVITATKDDTKSTLTILVFKDGEVDDNGLMTLPSCTAGTTTTCSNTLVLEYEVNKKDTDDTDSAAAAGSTDSEE